MRRLVRSKLEQVLGRGTRRRRRARRARHRAGRGQSVLHRGARQLHRSQGVDPPDAAGLEGIAAPREPPHPRPEPHRRRSPRRRGGRSRSPASSGACSAAPMLPGVYPELGRRRRGRRPPRRAARARSRGARPGGRAGYMFKHVVTQEVAYESLPFALRVDAPRARRRIRRASERGRVERHAGPLVTPLLAQRRTTRRSASTSGARGTRRRRRTRTQLRSTTSSGLRRSSKGATPIRARPALARAHELTGDWARARRWTRRRWQRPPRSTTRHRRAGRMPRSPR